jgi:hypothetical protein
MSEQELEAHQNGDSLQVSRLTRERDSKKLQAESAELDAVTAVTRDADNRRLRINVANAQLQLEEAKLQFGVRQLRPVSNEPWLAMGFALFGLVLGFATGVTRTSGASQSLVIGLFAFVGGSLLSYSGFRRFSAEASVEPRRVGQGLSGFSLGLLLGLVVGALVRTEPVTEAKPIERPVAPAKPAPAAPTAVPTSAASPAGATATAAAGPAASTTPTTGSTSSAPAQSPAPCPETTPVTRSTGFFLNADARQACNNVRLHLGKGGYENPALAPIDVEVLLDTFCSKQPNPR